MSESHITQDVIEFEKILKDKIIKSGLECETILYDERLTSSLAASDFSELGLKKSKRKEKGIIDSLSARIILQNYLDKIIT